MSGTTKRACPETSEVRKRRNGNENAVEDPLFTFSSRDEEDFSGTVRDTVDVGAVDGCEVPDELLSDDEQHR